MRLICSHSVSKEPDYPQSNEDFFWTAPDGKSCAMTDGASESFDSKSWGQYLCQVYTELIGSNNRALADEQTVRQILAESRRRFLLAMSKRQLTWSQQAAFDRGNFASLLGLRTIGRTLELLAIGDTVALWKSTEGKICSHVLQHPDDFKRHPVLLCSDIRGDAVVFGQERDRWAFLQLPLEQIDRQRVYLMTDALACYALLKARVNQWPLVEQACSLNGTDFKYWVSQKRMSQEMRKDDTTLAVIEF